MRTKQHLKILNCDAFSREQTKKHQIATFSSCKLRMQTVAIEPTDVSIYHLFAFYFY